MKQRHLRLLIPFLLVLLVLFAGGCTTIGREAYKAPQLNLPQSWAEEMESTGEERINEKFWEDFGDPALNRLIEDVLAKNTDILSAAIQVQQAKLEMGLSRTNLYPTFSAEASGSRSHNLDSHHSDDSYNISTGISYEIDLWNKYADSYKASQTEVEASIADQRSAALSVIGQTAELYWEIGYLTESLRITRDNIANIQKLLTINETKYAAGSVPRSDVINSQKNLLELQADLTQEQQSLSEARHALAVLSDQPPENNSVDTVQLTDTPLPDIAAGIPADILGRRPDLMAAELRLRKAHSEINTTRASFYPTISLTGALGASSDQLSEILSNPIASLGSDLILPFLQWQQTKINIQLAEENYREDVISFRSSLHTALKEVENLLSARSNNLEQREYLQQALSLASQAETISARRYNSGAEELSSLLESQNALRSARKAVTENHFRLLENTMQLYLALGGGTADGVI